MDNKYAVMVLHMKQAIVDTFKFMYQDFDDVYSIDIYYGFQKTTCVLGYELDYDRTVVSKMIDMMKTILNKTDSFAGQENSNDDVINIHVCPFDDFLITMDDIITLLNLDCV